MCACAASCSVRPCAHKLLTYVWALPCAGTVAFAWHGCATFAFSDLLQSLSSLFCFSGFMALAATPTGAAHVLLQKTLHSGCSKRAPDKTKSEQTPDTAGQPTHLPNKNLKETAGNTVSEVRAMRSSKDCSWHKGRYILRGVAVKPKPEALTFRRLAATASPGSSSACGWRPACHDRTRPASASVKFHPHLRHRLLETQSHGASSEL